jgi:hypothetical protein
MFEKTFEIIPHLVFPLYFMLIGLTYIPGTFGSLVLNGEFRTLFSPAAFKDAVSFYHILITHPLISVPDSLGTSLHYSQNHDHLI